MLSGRACFLAAALLPRPRPCVMRVSSPFELDALSLLFPSPILRVDLAEALPQGTLSALKGAVLATWEDHLAEQAELAAESSSSSGQNRRVSDDFASAVLAGSPLELNEEFYYFQKRNLGIMGHSSDPNPAGWLASEAAQDLMDAICACIAGYLERIAHHASRDVGRPWTAEDWAERIDPDSLHAWASVHQSGSTHPRHVHVGAVVSCVFYLSAPEGTGPICFFDPRGDIPPFERQIRHIPTEGELLIFPPWLSHAVAPTSGNSNNGEETSPRISLSFNLVDDELEGGRYGWGEATAGLEVVTLESDLGLEPFHRQDMRAPMGEGGEAAEQQQQQAALDNTPRETQAAGPHGGAAKDQAQRTLEEGQTMQSTLQLMCEQLDRMQEALLSEETRAAVKESASKASRGDDSSDAARQLRARLALLAAESRALIDELGSP